MYDFGYGVNGITKKQSSGTNEQRKKTLLQIII
jgi:hypothetical protein